MRLFIAIELPADVRAHLARVRDDLKSRIARDRLRGSNTSFTRDENLHITLKFLGEVEDDLAARVVESLANVGAGGRIEILAERVECFPDRGPVRILAAGFGGSVATLQALQQAIEERCQRLGFAREARAYRPHVTLARARPTLPPRVRELAAGVSVGLPGPEVEVRELALVRSHLGQQGSRYEVIARFGLTDQA